MQLLESSPFLDALGGELTEFRQAVREMLSREWSLSDLRARMLPTALWKTFEAQGWFDVLRPSSEGGLGLTAVEAAALFEAGGQFLLPGPLFASVVAGALCQPPDGSAYGVVAFAWSEHERPHLGRSLQTKVESAQVWGSKILVESADAVDKVIVVCSDHGQPALATVRLDQDRVDCAPMPSIDLCWRPFRVQFHGATAQEIMTISSELLQTIETYGCAMTAARLSGLISAVLEMSVDYAKSREQFGQPIAMFQAIRHRLADMAVLAATARNAAYFAAASIASHDPAATRRAASAKAWNARAGRLAVESALQIHGGIGFTDEHDLQLYYKHGLSLQGEWGDETEIELGLGKAALAQGQDRP